jgi:hypothetical protein
MSGNGKGSFVEIVIGMVKPSDFSLRNFYVPLTTSVVLFMLLAPGVNFVWLGRDFFKSTQTKPYIGWHLLLYVIAFFITALFFSVVFRTWPGSQHAFGQLESV